MLTLLTLVALASVALGIRVQVHTAAQAYYFRVNLLDITGSCGDSVSGVDLYVNNQWRGSDNKYGDSYDWNYGPTNVKFTDMLPISIRIKTMQGKKIKMWGIITAVSPGTIYSSSKTICDGEVSPTPKPTTRAPTAPTAADQSGETICLKTNNAGNFKWTSKNKQLYLNGNQFNMKGLSWFGFETGNYGLYGLDRHSEEWYLQWMVKKGFNAIRLPFSKAFMSSSSNRNKYKAFVQKAGQYGILIMPDFHSDAANDWRGAFWALDQNSAINMWGDIADLLKNEWNVFMADCFNEPHDVQNGQWNQWLDFCRKVAYKIWDKGANWLIMIEGTNSNCDIIGCCWGENLQGARNNPFTYNTNKYTANKLVYSPHVYTGDVTGNYAYSNAAWEAHWGYLARSSSNNKAAIMIGEFGTRGQTAWLNSLVNYLGSIKQRNHFFWCLNPNSGDTGGLLKDDWTTDETWKLNALAKLQPSPSKITWQSSSKVCISGLDASAYTDGEETTVVQSTANTADHIAMITIICILSIIIILCGVYVYILKKNKNNNGASFQEEIKDEDDIVADDGSSDNKNDDDAAKMITNTPTHEHDDDPQEIEVEMIQETAN